MIEEVRRLMTEEEAAKSIGMSEQWLAKERKAGRISYQQVGMRGIRYRAKHMNDYLDLLEVEAKCKTNEGDSSSESSGSRSGQTRRHGVSHGSIRTADKLADLQRARRILSELR